MCKPQQGEKGKTLHTEEKVGNSECQGYRGSQWLFKWDWACDKNLLVAGESESSHRISSSTGFDGG